MKKSIAFAVCLFALILISTTLSFGDIDPKYKLRERPHQELLSPPHGDQFEDVVLVIIPDWNNLCIVVSIKKDSLKENPTLQSLTKQELGSKIHSNQKRAR